MDRDRGERIIFQDHPSWRSRPGRHVRTVLAAVTAGVLAGLGQTIASGRAQSSWVAPAVAAALLLRLGLSALRRHATLYTVTDRRVLLERGLMRRRRTECPLTAVIGVTCRQTLRERMLRTGTVWFHTTDGHMSFGHVAEPQWLVQSVEALLERGPRDPSASDRRPRQLAAGGVSL